MVPKHSACIPGAVGAAKISISSDHTNMVKFKGAENDGFRKVYGELSIMLNKALRKIEENWAEFANSRNSGGNQSTHNHPHIYALIVTTNISLVIDQALRVSYSIPMRLPFHKNGNFTGRDREIAEIHRALHSADATIFQRRAMVLHGLGGMGKTQLAIQYAYIHQKDYTSIWWVNASTTQTISQGFLGIAQQLLSYHTQNTTASPKPDSASIAAALGLPPDSLNRNGELNTSGGITEIVVKAITSWFAAEDNNGWLLIFDNYDDLRNVNIFDFLHPGSSGSILITSRSRDICHIGKGLEVQEVIEDEALEILRTSARRDRASFRKGMHSSNVPRNHSSVRA